jgi:Ca2+-binding EF-hand superfamily protein
MAVDPALPDWFRSLDKNNDAKVSRAEFIGTNEQFRRIDLNADGVISPAEAIAADEWFRSEIPP